MDPTSPGWYPDPQGTGGERWFDGTNWSTDNVRPAPTPPPPPGYGQAAPQYADPYAQAPAGQHDLTGAPLPPPVPEYTQQPQSSSNTLSIIGIVCGVIGLFFCPPLFGIGGIVLGVVGKNKGERLGTIAIVVSSVCLVLGMIIGAALFIVARH